MLLSLISLACSVFFFYKWNKMWKDFEALSKEYGRLWHECKQLKLERKMLNDNYKSRRDC